MRDRSSIDSLHYIRIPRREKYDELIFLDFPIFNLFSG